MTRILAYTSPARGHLFPIIPTLLELGRRGHEVHVCTLASELGRVRALGIHARPIASAIEARALDDWKASSQIGAVQRALGTWVERAPHEVADLEAAIAETRPDVLLVDINAWGALAAAEASGIPFAVFAPYFLELEVPGRPPFGLGLAPGEGLLASARDRLLRFVTRRTIGPFLAKLNALRSGLSLPPLSGLSELPLRGDRVLYLTAEPFEYTHGGWPEKVRFVGPGLWQPPAAEAPAFQPSSRPTVLVTCSTELQEDGRLIEVALEALSSEDVDVIATTAAIDPARFHAPANARVVRYAPHGPILRHAAAVVCHGGMGITQKALAAGVPVCVVPFGRDQLDVARHVEVAGAGTSIAATSLGAAKLRAAVQSARGMKDGALRIAEAFAGAGGPLASAAELEALAPRRAIAVAHARVRLEHEPV